MTVTLDWLLERFPAPKVLKIDVEGAEHNVLSGGRKILSQVQPIIICEAGSEESPCLTEFFHSNGYTLYDLDTRKKTKTAVYNKLACPSHAQVSLA